MSGENRLLVTDEPVEIINNKLEFKTSFGKLLIILEEFIEYTYVCQFNKEELKDVSM